MAGFYQQDTYLREMLADTTAKLADSGIRMLPREWASAMLEEVANAIETDTQSDVSPREVGWALRRVFGNDLSQMAELMKGYMEADHWYSGDELPEDLH